MQRHCPPFGIGKKTAERMCLELKDKIAGELVIPQGGGTTITNAPIKKRPSSTASHNWAIGNLKSMWLSSLILFQIWTPLLYKND